MGLLLSIIVGGVIGWIASLIMRTDAQMGILGNIGVVVLPDQIAVSEAHDAFGEDGKLYDGKMHASIEGLGRNLAEFLARMNTSG